MSKPYWSGQGGRTGSSYVDDHDDAPTHKISGYGSGEYDSGYNSGFYSNGGYRSTEEYRSSLHAHDDQFDDDEDYEYYERDLRWRWIAGLAVAVLVVAVIATVVVMRGDSATPTAQTETPPATSTAPRTVIATIPPSPAAPPPVQLSPETVVTITTTPPAVTTTPSAAAAPPPEVAAPPAPEAAPPAPVVDPRTVTYTVTGTKPMLDFVSVIYTDEQGLPRTDVNVTLPWSKTLVLEPGVDFESVTATSITGQLNCAITDAAGATLVAQTNNSMIATCTG